MLAVLMLFLLPWGGGIPGGVLLAQAKGLPWPLTAGLYLLSDVLLALAFEPLLRLFAHFAGKVAFLAQLRLLLRLTLAATAAQFGGAGAGPFTLVLIAFGADPMTGRAAALAAGYGFLAGWAVAIAGDMLYYAVFALATLRLQAYIHNPNVTMWVVLAIMLLVPMLTHRLRCRWRVRA